MCASSDISILLLLLSLSLSSDKAVTEVLIVILLLLLLYPPPQPAPLLMTAETPVPLPPLGGESHQLLTCSSESDGEMLTRFGNGKKLGPLTSTGECECGCWWWWWWWFMATCGCAVFLLWISHSKCFSPFLKNSLANSHLSGTIFLKP